jgi:drug/metabolite transporter (DMT)-like permease
MIGVKPSVTRTTKGYLIGIVGTAMWSATAVFIRYLTVNYQMPPMVVAFWRDLFVTLALATSFAVLSPSLLRIERRHLKFLLFYGFILSIFNSLWTVAVALTGAAVATVLAYSSPAFTALAGRRLYGERLDGVKVVAVLLSIGGCVLVSGAYDPAAWQVNPLGIVTGLGAGVAFAGYSLMGKASAERGINPWTATLYIFATAAVLLLVYDLALGGLQTFFSEPPAVLLIASLNLLWLGASLAGWGALIVLALGPTIGGYGLYTVSLTYLPASVANLIATLEPSMTAVLAYLFLGETFTAPQLTGGGLVILGVILLRIGEGRIPAAATA